MKKLTVRIPDELSTRLELEARRTTRSVNSLLIYISGKYLDYEDWCKPNKANQRKIK